MTADEKFLLDRFAWSAQLILRWKRDFPRSAEKMVRDSMTNPMGYSRHAQSPQPTIDYERKEPRG